MHPIATVLVMAILGAIVASILLPPRPPPVPTPPPVRDEPSMAFLGYGYCIDDNDKVMPNVQKYGVPLPECKQICHGSPSCLGISHNETLQEGNLCHLHGVTTPHDSSWSDHAMGSPATTITGTHEQSAESGYECYVKTNLVDL